MTLCRASPDDPLLIVPLDKGRGKSAKGDDGVGALSAKRPYVSVRGFPSCASMTGVYARRGNESNSYTKPVRIQGIDISRLHEL